MNLNTLKIKSYKWRFFLIWNAQWGLKHCIDFDLIWSWRLFRRWLYLFHWLFCTCVCWISVWPLVDNFWKSVDFACSKFISTLFFKLCLAFDMLLKIEIYRRIKNRCFVVFDDFFKFAQKFRFQINVRIIGDTCKTGVRKWTEIIATGRNGYCITL